MIGEIASPSVNISGRNSPWYYIKTLDGYVFGGFLSESIPPKNSKKAYFHNNSITCNCGKECSFYQNSLYLSHNISKLVEESSDQSGFKNKTTYYGYYKLIKNRLVLKLTLNSKKKKLRKPILRKYYYNYASRGFLTGRQKYIKGLKSYTYNSKKCYFMSLKSRKNQYKYNQKMKGLTNSKECSWKKEGYYCSH